MKFAFEKDDRVWVCHCAPRETIERQFGPLTDEQYEAIVTKGVPDTAIRLEDDWVPPRDRPDQSKWKIINGKLVVPPSDGKPG